MVLLCCEATAVLPQTHQQCQVVKVWKEGGGVGAPETGNTESGGMVACREEGEERYENGLHPGHIPLTYIIYTECGGG